MFKCTRLCGPRTAAGSGGRVETGSVCSVSGPRTELDVGTWPSLKVPADSGDGMRKTVRDPGQKLEMVTPIED